MLFLVLLATVGLIEARLRPSFTLGGMSSVIGGVPASPGEFPWQLSQTRNGGHSCGASLLSSTRALSAAHCVDGAAVNTIGIIAGLHDRTNTAGSVSSSVTRLIVHSGFDNGQASFANDIAIIELGSAISSNGGTIAYATLPPDNNQDFAGQTCVISGWGRTGTSQTLPNVLQKASIGVITQQECVDAIQGIGDIWTSHICLLDPAGRVGSCNGDSGGPLNCPLSGSTVVAGVTSFGISSSGNCLQTYPSVYTRTSAYLGWIANPSS